MVGGIATIAVRSEDATECRRCAPTANTIGQRKQRQQCGILSPNFSSTPSACGGGLTRESSRSVLACAGTRTKKPPRGWRSYLKSSRIRLKVVVYADGRMEARGVLSEDVCKLHENGHANEDESLCENGLVSQCAAPSGLRLSARRHAAFYSWRMGDRHRLGTPVDRPKLS